MKIVTLNPPYFPMFSRASRSPAVTKSSTLYYPFLLAYTTGVLEDDGFEVKLIDAPAAKLDREVMVKVIKAFGPDLLVCETSTPSIENDMDVIARLKHAGVPYVVAVGTHVSAMPDEVLARYQFVDVVARREYEYTVRAIARSMRERQGEPELRRIKGISFRYESQIIHTEEREPIEYLDRLPFVSRVYRDHLRPHINTYFYGANLHPVVAILTGRGCPHQCAYCVYPQTMMGNRYRLRSVRNVVDELEFIKRELPEVREVFLEDDTLTVDRLRACAICNEIMRRSLKITWSTNSRADADYETMRLMRLAGCRLVCVGFESADQNILDGLGKNINQEQYYRFRRDAARAGLLVHGCFMYGNPGETRETMHATLAMAKRLNCDTAQFYPIMVYPGTRAYSDFRSRGLIQTQDYREWLTADGLHNCVVSLPGISREELVAFADYSRRKYYLRPRYILGKIMQMVTKPRETKRLLRASGTLVKHLVKPSIK